MPIRPILIGIGGDSGSGKHTSVDAILDVLGEKNVLHVSGDDYHKWERGDPHWKSRTHLQPDANNLDQFLRDIQALKDGKKIRKVEYDHHTGKFTRPKAVLPRRYIIVSGLHPFYIHKMRRLFDLRIFLKPDENLRWHWKILRDMKKRGYTMQQVISVLRQRERDSVDYIIPQAMHAHLVVEPHVGRGIEAGNPDQALHMRVKYLQRGSVNLYKLSMELRALDGLLVESFKDNFSEAQSLKVEGKFTEKQIAAMAKSVVENLTDLTTAKPKWRRDYLGLFQIIFLLNLQHAQGLKTST